MIQILQHARLYRPEPDGIRHLVVGGGRVLAILEEPPTLAGVPHESLDLEGRYVVPGLVDAHVHLGGGGGEAGPASRVPSLAIERLTAAGTTTVVGLLGTDDLTRTPVDLHATVRGLRALGLDAWMWTGGYHVPPATVTGSRSAPELSAVRSDIVLLAECIGVGELALSDHRSSQPTLDELLRIAAEAHVAGLMTGKAGVVHLHLGDGERGLDLVRRALDTSELPARVFHPTHVNRRAGLFDEALELARHGCTIDITTFPPELAEGDELLAVDALERAWSSGIDPARITLSSDGGGCLPRFDEDARVRGFDVGDPATLIDSLVETVRRGAELEQALPPFTSNPADLLRLDAGRITAGGPAHLVVLDAADHKDLGDGPGRDLVRDVMVHGAWHRRQGRQVVRDPFSPSSSSSATHDPAPAARET